jgi:hypothetical protein
MKITFDFDKTKEKHSTDQIRFDLALHSTQLASLIIDIKRRLEDKAQYYWELAHDDDLDEEKVTCMKSYIVYNELQYTLDYIDKQEAYRGIGATILHWEDTEMFSEVIKDFDGKMDGLHDLVSD